MLDAETKQFAISFKAQKNFTTNVGPHKNKGILKGTLCVFG
jgi:hypothetical protein